MKLKGIDARIIVALALLGATGCEAYASPEPDRGPGELTVQGKIQAYSDRSDFVVHGEDDPLALTLKIEGNGDISRQEFEILPGYGLALGHSRTSWSEPIHVFVNEEVPDEFDGGMVSTPIFRRTIKAKGSSMSGRRESHRAYWGAEGKFPNPGRDCELFSYETDSGLVAGSFRIELVDVPSAWSQQGGH